MIGATDLAGFSKRNCARINPFWHKSGTRNSIRSSLGWGGSLVVFRCSGIGPSGATLRHVCRNQQTFPKTASFPTAGISR